MSKRLNTTFGLKATNRSPSGQANPEGYIAKQSYVSEKMLAEMLGESSNDLFEILEDWESVLQAENIDFEELGL